VGDDLDMGLVSRISWIMVYPQARVTSRGPSLLPECFSLIIKLWPDDGATNEIKVFTLISQVYLKRPTHVGVSSVPENIC
jgi:hypothetical protein